MMQSLNWEIDTINQKIEENQQSLYFMLSNAYDRLKESGLIE